MLKVVLKQRYRWKGLFVTCLFGVLCRFQQSFSYTGVAGYLTRFLGFQPVHSLLVQM